MLEPKFKIGQEVKVRGISTSEYDTDSTTVTGAMRRIPGETFNIHTNKVYDDNNWVYQTEHQPDPYAWWAEESLHAITEE